MSTMIKPEDVKRLRDQTGAGIMDCKRALEESGGDVDKAVAWLREKGLSTAAKKAGRVAREGVIASYIHHGARLGVLLVWLVARQSSPEARLEASTST